MHELKTIERIIAVAGLFFIMFFVGCSSELNSLKVQTMSNQDFVTIDSSSGIDIVTITSPTGIGTASLEQIGKAWPDGIELRLHLKGLEHFEVYNGTTRLEAAVSNIGQDTRQWKDGDESTPLDSSSDYWMIIQTSKASTDTKTVDYFSITLPNRFLPDANQSIEFKWIDFYR